MSEPTAIKLVIDTNIWISFLIGKKISPLRDLIISGKAEVYFSNELADEFLTVIKRPKLRKYFNEADALELLTLFNDKVIFVEPHSSITACRDPKDNFILDLAVKIHADYIITGDEDLLTLNPFENINILNPHDFETVIKSL